MQRDPNIHREIHELVQGTEAWNAYRANHDNASDAPAMMACSPYKTRSDLIRQYATGISEEIDTRTQKLFDDGHRFEALARPLAENIIGQDIYPVTASLGRMSASFDGLTLCETIVWEHKSINEQIRSCEAAADLPLMYRVQMEQQLHIVGAERALFSATRWDAAGNLVEQKHLWYTPDLELRAQIISGWEQFGKDVANYTPIEQTAKVEAAPAAAIPALVVQTEGRVVSSNLMIYQKAADQFLATIKTDLQDDQDFADAEYNVKFCSEAENKLELAKEAALAQTSSIDEVLRTVDHIRAQFRAKRLELEKLVKVRKEQIKETILNEGKHEYTEHIGALETEISPIRLQLPQPDFAGAMKNKRTLASLHDAVNTTLANAKIAANQQASDMRAKLAWYNASVGEHAGLFRDLQQIIGKAAEDFQLVVRTRIADHQRAEQEKQDALRAKIAAEEKAKAEAAVLADLERKQREEASRVAAEQAERARQVAEQLQAEDAAAVEAAKAPPVVHTRETALAAAHQSIAHAASTSAASGIAAAIADQGRLADLADAQVPTDLFGSAPAGPPSLKLGQINERIAPLSISADGLRALGFEPAAVDKSARLYHEQDFPRICAAMLRHIGAAQAKFAA